MTIDVDEDGESEEEREIETPIHFVAGKVRVH